MLGVGELYVVAHSIGLTIMWPALHILGTVWLLLPAMLWRHFSESGSHGRSLPSQRRRYV